MKSKLNDHCPRNLWTSMPQLQLQVLITLVYVGIIICGCLLTIFMNYATTDFGGQCILFLDVTWMNDKYFFAQFGDKTACDFTTYLPICTCITHGSIMGAYNVYVLIKRIMTKNHSPIDTMWVLPWFVVNALVAVFTIATAMVVTMGFTHTCSQLLSGQTKYERCSDFENNTEWSSPEKVKLISSHFFRNLSIVQLSSCILALLWIILVIISSIKMRQLCQCTPTIKSQSEYNYCNCLSSNNTGSKRIVIEDNVPDI